MDDILAAIDGALRRKGLSDAAASKLAVGHPSLIKNFRAARDGEKRYNVPALVKLAEVLDLEFYFGPPRPPVETHLQHELREPGSNGPSSLAPPTGYVTFVWHHACDPGTGIPPVALSEALAVRHGLDPDAHRMACTGARPERPQDPAAFAVIDAAAPREGGPHLWAFRAARDQFVEIGPVQFLDRRPFAVPYTAHPALRDLSAPGALLLGRVLWTSSKPL